MLKQCYALMRATSMYARANEQVAECRVGRYNECETPVAYRMQQVLQSEEEDDDGARVAALYAATPCIPFQCAGDDLATFAACRGGELAKRGMDSPPLPRT